MGMKLKKFTENTTTTRGPYVTEKRYKSAGTTKLERPAPADGKVIVITIVCREEDA